MKIFRNIFIIVTLLTFSLAVYLQLRSYDSKIQLSQEYKHATNLRLNRLMDILRIRPGMTILNIGAGRGMAAYKFAEELKGTGKVFATDIKADLIEYITQEARRRGLRNLYPVLVKKKGVDEFYCKHRYDLIIVFYLFIKFDDPVDYFTKMRHYLTDNGRLFFCFNKDFLPFSLEDFTDVRGLIKELARESADGPFYKGLRESTLELIKQDAGGKPRELLKNAIITDFNNMQRNPNFSTYFLRNDANMLRFKKKVSFTTAETFYVNWLLMRLKKDISRKESIFQLLTLPFFERDLDFKDRDGGKMGEFFKKTGTTDWCGQLNKLLIIQKYRPYLYAGKTALDEPPYPYTSIRGKRFVMVKEVLKKAGFKLENEYDFIPFVALFSFTVNEDFEGKI